VRELGIIRDYLDRAESDLAEALSEAEGSTSNLGTLANEIESAYAMVRALVRDVEAKIRSVADQNYWHDKAAEDRRAEAAERIADDHWHM
jgi:hypothetical protein